MPVRHFLCKFCKENMWGIKIFHDRAVLVCRECGHREEIENELHL